MYRHLRCSLPPCAFPIFQIISALLPLALGCREISTWTSCRAEAALLDLIKSFLWNYMKFLAPITIYYFLSCHDTRYDVHARIHRTFRCTVRVVVWILFADLFPHNRGHQQCIHIHLTLRPSGNNLNRIEAIG